MEHGPNSLADWLSERNAGESPSIDREKMYTMFIQICTAVKYIHGSENSEKLLGNLKPHRILLFPNGLIKLADIQAYVNNETTNSTDTIKTNPYLPNEFQEDVGKYHIDVFSLG